MPQRYGPATAGEVLALIREGASTRSEIGRTTGLSRTAVAARIDGLMRTGLVTEGETAPSAGGRPAGTLRFRAEGGVVLAAAIGRSRSQLAVCNLAGEVLAADEEDRTPGAAPEDLMPQVVERLAALMRQARVREGAVRAVGLSIPGSADFAAGVSLDAPTLPGWNGVPLAPWFAPLTDAPVFVDNDANVMAAAERDGHLRHHRNLLLLKASTGLGLGIVVDGRLVRGGWGAVGELGHVRVAGAEGLACRCGSFGCLETVAAGWALVQQLSGGGREVAHVRELVAHALDGDAAARSLLRESGRRVGEALAVVVTLLNPEAVVVGGDMAAAYDIYVAGLRETLHAGALPVVTRDLELLPSTHGATSGLVGCAAMALDEVLSVRAVDELVVASR